MITYRQAEPSDSPLLAQLHGAHFRRAWTHKEFDSFFLRDGVIGIIAEDNEPVGFIFCWAVAGECELLALAVNESHRGQGIARELCERSFKQAATHQAKTVHLEVAVSNKSAQSLYKALGFETVRRRKDYYHYPDGTLEDAITMRCDM